MKTGNFPARKLRKRFEAENRVKRAVHYWDLTDSQESQIDTARAVRTKKRRN